MNHDDDYVGVSSGSELLDSTVGAIIFDAVSERGFVLERTIITATRLFDTSFGLHYNINTICNRTERSETKHMNVSELGIWVTLEFINRGKY